MRKSLCISSLGGVWTIVWLLAWAPCALAVNPAEWQIVQQINRTDTSRTWTSPTAVDVAGMTVWQWDFEITRVTATVNIPFTGEVTEDITTSFEPEFLSRSGVANALPAVLIDDVLVEPEIGTSVDMLIDLDGSGFGRAVFSDIALGSVNVPLFGSRPVERMNIEASLSVTGVVPEPGLVGLLGVTMLALCRRGQSRGTRRT